MTARPDQPIGKRPIDGRLRDLIVLAVVFSAGHHMDVIRGNQVGWPMTDEVNA